MPIAVGTPVFDYAKSHKVQRLVFLRALKALDDAFITPLGTDDLTLNACFSATSAIVGELPSDYTTQLSNYRTALGVGGNFTSLSTTLKRQCVAAVRGWLNTRAILADYAAE